MQEVNPETVCVSAIIPTRNRAELVVKAVVSALHQDFKGLEVIVVIDGEDPRTRDALDGFMEARVRVIDLAVNMGGADARNAGVRAARGEWVAFLDDDDEWLAPKLSRQMAAARRSGAAWPVVSSRMIVRTPARELIRPLRSYQSQRPVSEFLFCRGSLKDGPFALQTSTLLARRELMLAVPFRSGLKRHQDWDWVLRAEQINGVEFQVLDEPLVIHRAEDARESVGRAQDWEFSMEWGREMRPFFSAKAYSWFLATECASRAIKSRAGFRAYAGILRRFVLDGRPSPGSAITMAFFLGLPRGWRRRVHSLARRWRDGATNSGQRNDVQATIGMEL
jgi:glycosyltransferase involved in cell wall biosynthesis